MFHPDNKYTQSSFQEPMGDALGHHGAEGNAVGQVVEPPTHLPPDPPAIAPKFGPTPTPPPASPVQPTSGALHDNDLSDLSIPEDVDFGDEMPIEPYHPEPYHPEPSDHGSSDHADVTSSGLRVPARSVESVKTLTKHFEERPGVSKPLAEAAAENMHEMEESASELPKPKGVVAKAHRGFMDGMSAFFGSWWGMLIIAILVLGLVISLLAIYGHKASKKKHGEEAPSVPAGASPSPKHTPPPKRAASGEEVTVFLAWEASREPTQEDKVILFNVGSPDIAWSCCAQSIFKNDKEVHVRLPPGNYAARTVHKSGIQQVCSLETARRVAFTDSATRCSQGSSTSSTEIDLGMCDTLVSDDGGQNI